MEFHNHSSVNELSGDEDLSIMFWRASQPFGAQVPLDLQFCNDYKIGFCGDWFENEGFGRVEGAIISALKLTEKFKSAN